MSLAASNSRLPIYQKKDSSLSIPGGLNHFRKILRLFLRLISNVPSISLGRFDFLFLLTVSGLSERLGVDQSKQQVQKHDPKREDAFLHGSSLEVEDRIKSLAGFYLNDGVSFLSYIYSRASYASGCVNLDVLNTKKLLIRVRKNASRMTNNANEHRNPEQVETGGLSLGLRFNKNG